MNHALFVFDQGAYHEKVVPAVCQLVSDASQPVRVRGHAASAIGNFTDTEDVPEEAVTPHLDTFLSALCSCLNDGVPQPVQVRAGVFLRRWLVFVDLCQYSLNRQVMLLYCILLKQYLSVWKTLKQYCSEHSMAAPGQ